MTLDYVSNQLQNQVLSTARVDKLEGCDLFRIPKDLFELVNYEEYGIKADKVQSDVELMVGMKYYLQSPSCDGFEMKKKTYEVVGFIDTYHDVQIDSVIVKQVDGNQDNIFTLSKNDCKALGIDFENGLMLFPRHLDWKLERNKLEFNPNDLGTNPTSTIDGTIKVLLFKLHGFKDYKNGTIISPSGKIVEEKNFTSTVFAQTVDTLAFNHNKKWDGGVKLWSKIVKPKQFTYKYGNFITDEDTIFLLVKVLFDNHGISVDYAKGINPNDVFTICWNETNCITLEEAEERERREVERAKAVKSKLLSSFDNGEISKMQKIKPIRKRGFKILDTLSFYDEDYRYRLYTTSDDLRKLTDTLHYIINI